MAAAGLGARRRAVVAATALASVSVLTLRILFPGEVDDLASQSLRLDVMILLMTVWAVRLYFTQAE